MGTSNSPEPPPDNYERIPPDEAMLAIEELVSVQFSGGSVGQFEWDTLVATSDTARIGGCLRSIEYSETVWDDKGAYIYELANVTGIVDAIEEEGDCDVPVEFASILVWGPSVDEPWGTVVCGLGTKGKLSERSLGHIPRESNSTFGLYLHHHDEEGYETVAFSDGVSVGDTIEIKYKDVGAGEVGRFTGTVEELLSPEGLSETPDIDDLTPNFRVTPDNPDALAPFEPGMTVVVYGDAFFAVRPMDDTDPPKTETGKILYPELYHIEGVTEI